MGLTDVEGAEILELTRGGVPAAGFEGAAHPASCYQRPVRPRRPLQPLPLWPSDRRQPHCRKSSTRTTRSWPPTPVPKFGCGSSRSPHRLDDVVAIGDLYRSTGSPRLPPSGTSCAAVTRACRRQLMAAFRDQIDFAMAARTRAHEGMAPGSPVGASRRLSPPPSNPWNPGPDRSACRPHDQSPAGVLPRGRRRAGGSFGLTHVHRLDDSPCVSWRLLSLDTRVESCRN